MQVEFDSNKNAAVGRSLDGRLLTVCYTLREEEAIRLISGREATRREKRQYAEGI